jgi:tRNA pseudouridine55 synthase
MNGALILDKPEGITSHTAVLKARRALGEKRIGHLGTLDPFATGVLVLLIGHATRLARFYTDREKTYEGTIRFGYATDTYDRTGTPLSPAQDVNVTQEALVRAFSEFTGPQLQLPPAVSAKKIGGVPAYRLARKGQTPQLSPVPVTVHELQLVSFAGEVAAFRARVSSGTYIRSLAHDIGRRFGCGAHLDSLRRTSVGEFTEREAITLDSLESATPHGAIPVLPMESLLPEFPAMILNPSMAASAMHGNCVTGDCAGRYARLLNQLGELIGIAECESPNVFHPIAVFQAAEASTGAAQQHA